MFFVSIPTTTIVLNAYTDNKEVVEKYYGERYVLSVSVSNKKECSIFATAEGHLSVTLHDYYIRVFKCILTVQHHNSFWTMDYTESVSTPQSPLYYCYK